MFTKLREIKRRQRFITSPISILINPLFLIRRGLSRGIRRNAGELKGVMLDFGCGSKPYRDFFAVDKYIGLDISESGHDHAGESIDVFYDGKRIPFESGFFDAIFSSEVFEHVFNLDDILTEVNRVLKSGGTMLITLPFIWEEHEKPYDFARYTSFGIKHLLEKHGFEVIRLEKSTNDIETVFQVWINYLVLHVLPQAPKLQMLSILFFVFPLNLLAILLSAILPRNFDFYHNNIVVARKLRSA